MTKLDLLEADLTQLSNEELQERIRTIRTDRMVSKAAKYTKPTATAKAKAKSKITDLLAGMTIEEKRKFLEGLR